MIVAFAIGVLAAMRTELFPPQVEGGSSAAGAGAVSRPKADERWRARMITDSVQEYSAGRCITDWRSSIDVVVNGHGSVRGNGRSRLRRPPRCPFPTSQPQITRYDFRVGGRFSASAGFRLILSNFRATQGIFDYGGFALALGATNSILEIPVAGTRGGGRVTSRAITDLGKVVRARSVARIECRTCSA
jgi:hypothetical protein